MSTPNTTSEATVTLTKAELSALIARLEKAEAQAKAQPSTGLRMKVSDKGGLSVYGLGRWPVTLYRGQWERLLEKAEDIKAFIAANADKLSTKE